MKPKLTIFDRVGRRSTFFLTLFSCFVMAAAGVLLSHLWNDNVENNLAIDDVVQQKFRNGTYVNLKVPPVAEAPKNLFINYRGEQTEVELLPVASQKVDGKIRLFIALRPTHKDDTNDLAKIIKQGNVCGELSANTPFDLNDQNRIKRLYPQLDFQNYCLIEVFPNGAKTTGFIGLMLLGCWMILLIPAIRRIVISRAHQRLWADALRTQYSIAASARIPAFNRELVDSRAKFFSNAKPLTSRLFAITLDICWNLVITLLFCTLAIAIQNPMGNPWMCVGVGIAFVLTVAIQHRVAAAISAWKPAKPLKEIANHFICESSFHQFHRKSLESVGFSKIGLYESASSGAELFVSADKTVAALLAWTETPGTIHQDCRFKSFLTDNTAIGSSTAGLSLCAEKDDSPNPTDLWFHALERHYESLRSRCEEDNLRAIELNQSNVVQTLVDCATQTKANEQRELAEKQGLIPKTWNWMPQWLSTPIFWPRQTSERAV